VSLTTSIQDWLAHLTEREHSAIVARRHIAAETSTDVDAICVTVSPDVFFALPVRTRAGQELRVGSVLTDAAAVRGYYEARSGSYVVRDSAQLTSLSTDWYVFNETQATLLGTGPVGDVDATGVEWVVSSAVLFPTATDGIRGEICATRHPMDDVIRGTVGASPGDALANARLLDRFSLALRDAAWEAAAGELSEGHTMAVRLDPGGVHMGTGPAEAAAHLASLAGGAADLTLLCRVATDWYVFAEYLLQLDAGGSRRLALLQPVEDGRVVGTFGYGWDEA